MLRSRSFINALITHLASCSINTSMLDERVIL